MKPIFIVYYVIFTLSHHPITKLEEIGWRWSVLHQILNLSIFYLFFLFPLDYWSDSFVLCCYFVPAKVKEQLSTIYYDLTIPNREWARMDLCNSLLRYLIVNICFYPYFWITWRKSLNGTQSAGADFKFCNLIQTLVINVTTINSNFY